jgi:hypothetical protein
MITTNCIWTHINPDVSRGPASEWCEAICVMKIAIAASENICQGKPKVTVSVDEEDG